MYQKPWEGKTLNIFFGRLLGYLHVGTHPSPVLILGKFGFLFFFSMSSVVALPACCRCSPRSLMIKAIYAPTKSMDDARHCDKLELVVEIASNLHLLSFLVVGCCVFFLYWGITIVAVTF